MYMFNFIYNIGIMTSFILTVLWSGTLLTLINLVAPTVHYVTTNNSHDSNSNTLKLGLGGIKKMMTVR